MTSAPLLQIRGLKVSVRGQTHSDVLIRDLNLEIAPAERLGLVGESGSGKTVTALAVAGLADPEGIAIVGGEIIFDGRDLLKLNRADFRRVRGREISMIFQEPLTALNPVMRIGDQITEVIIEHQPTSKAEARAEAVRLLHRVGISDPDTRYGYYPHQFSGGMRQRVMIAMALACRPKLLIADEPTTALDVTIQAQIMKVLDDIQKETGVAILLISHNLALVGSFCNRVAVMYAGDVVEEGSARDVLRRPNHPYTKGLLACLPREVGSGHARQRSLPEIQGQVPSAERLPQGCRFSDRCQVAGRECARFRPPLQTDGPTARWRCIHGIGAS